jgi:hypothetical protein
MGKLAKWVLWVLFLVAVLAFASVNGGPATAPAGPAATQSIPADGAPVVDYTTVSEPGVVEPNDQEYVKYRDNAPMYDPLGAVIPAPPDNASAEQWRAFSIAQCERNRAEPAWYRRGAGCHVIDGPTNPEMVYDLPPTERADLDKKHQDTVNKICDSAQRIGFSCNVIDSDGP